MRHVVIGVVVLVSAFAPIQTRAECAWILWVKVYAKDMKDPTSGKADHSVEPYFHEPRAFVTKEECDREARSMATLELSLRYRSDVKHIEYPNCLPDTIDPRGRRAGAQ